ncbi:MAG: molybdopterin-guanine dinucleotide biosynthesis protein B [Myxococcota bacterium]
MEPRQPRIFAFAAPSGTGKTTLVCALIERLKALGHSVGAIKSDAHRVQLDTPGKDTHRMRKAGSATTALVSRDQIAVFRDAPGGETSLEEIVRVFFSDVDFVLAEGFRSHGHPTVVVRRRGIDFEGWTWPANVVALASDVPGDGRDDLPVFDLDDVDAIADFVRGRRKPER